MKAKLLCAIALMSVCMTTPIYAKDIHAEIENMNIQNISAAQNLTWEETNGFVKGMDAFGNIKTGKFFDENGEIYDTGSSSSFYIIRGNYNKAGEYFDNDGKMVNLSNLNADIYYSYAMDLENGKKLSFPNKQEYNDFLEYYKTQYRVESKSVPSSTKFHQEDDSVTLELLMPEPSTREMAVNDIIKEFGSISGNDIYDKILNACNKVKDIKSNNQSDYLKMSDAIENKSGSPWHICKIVSILLDDSDVYNEIVHGTFNGADHYWIRCKDNEKWIYVDPTFYLTGYISFLNIDYNSYISSYLAN